MAKDYNHSNPAFEGKVDGVAANHSSEVKSVSGFEHAQSDDALQDVPPPQDPNISGKPQTSQLHPWRAGAMSAWQENDDYRRFFEAGHVGESATTHRHETVHDLDYDDNHGIPLAIGEIHGYAGEPAGDKNLSHGDKPTADEFPLGPVVRRRI
jgi:hypothetical protein